MTEVPALPAKPLFRVGRIEYAGIEVDTAGLIEEWKDDATAPWDRDAVVEALHRIGVTDLLYSGDFIRVLDKGTEESIQ